MIPYQMDGVRKVGEKVLHRWSIQLKLKRRKRISFFDESVEVKVFLYYDNVNIYISELRIKQNLASVLGSKPSLKALFRFFAVLYF